MDATQQFATEAGPSWRAFLQVSGFNRFLGGTMRVVDANDESYGWFLLEEDGSLFLEASCNYSVFGYTFMIQLNAREVGEYKQQGRAYLHQLAQYIQDSVPVHEATQSIYKGRDVSPAYMEKVIAAVKAWRMERQSNGG